MQRLTQQEMTDNARQMALALLEICRRKMIRPTDASLMIGAACAEAMGAIEGHAGAVESLRLLADIAERDCLRAN